MRAGASWLAEPESAELLCRSGAAAAAPAARSSPCCCDPAGFWETGAAPSGRASGSDAAASSKGDTGTAASATPQSKNIASPFWVTDHTKTSRSYSSGNAHSISAIPLPTVSLARPGSVSEISKTQSMGTASSSFAAARCSTSGSAPVAKATKSPETVE